MCLSLDEIAIQKTDVDRRLAEVDQAIAQLKAELEPKTLSQLEMATIERVAEQVRERVDQADHDPVRQREDYRLINL